MLKRRHNIELIVDNRKISINGDEVELRIDGLSIWSSELLDSIFTPERKSSENFETFNVLFLLRVMKAMFGHPDRYKIVVDLANSPKTFTKIQNSFGFTSPTLDFHLKKLLNEMVIEKNEKKKYVLTIIGEVLLDYFSGLLQKIRELRG